MPTTLGTKGTGSCSLEKLGKIQRWAVHLALEKGEAFLQRQNRDMAKQRSQISSGSPWMRTSDSLRG
jgi:hypothetical protein